MPATNPQSLADLARERLENVEDREAIERDIAAEVRRLNANGSTMAELAKVLDLSRQGLWKLLNRNPDRKEQE